jgi:hypothetical protein
MAEANLNKAHQVLTYLMLLFFPTILSWLLTKLAKVFHDLMSQWEWNHVHLAVHHHPRKHRKKKKARLPSTIEDQVRKERSLTPTYLLLLALIAFKVGCCIEHSMRCLKVALTIKRLPKLVAFAIVTNLPYQVPRIRFDINSFVIGVNTYVLIMLGNCPDQFKDLKIHSEKDDTEVEGIKRGLEIKGTGTFKFYIEDDNRGVHLIKIPNSKYVPDLKVCFLSPHHWVQEAKDHYPLPKGMKMEEDDEALMLILQQRKHRQTIPYHPLTSTPSFQTALALRTYRTFVALYEAAEAQYYCREHVLQMPADSTSPQNSRQRRTCTLISKRSHLWPLREPPAMT